MITHCRTLLKTLGLLKFEEEIHMDKEMTTDIQVHTSAQSISERMQQP